MNDQSPSRWHALKSAIIAWRTRHHMGAFDVKVFCGSLLGGLLVALAMGWIIVAQQSDSARHYAPVVGTLLGLVIGNALGNTDVWYSPDWFPPKSYYLRGIVVVPCVLLGFCLGLLVEGIWGIGVR